MDTTDNTNISAQDINIFKESIRTGIIIAALGIVWALIMFFAGLEGLQWLNYLFILVIAIVLFVEGKKFRENKLANRMTFGQGFRFVFFASLISTIISVIYNFIHFNYISTNFVNDRFNDAIADMEATQTPEQIEQAIPFMEPWFTPMSFTLISLVSGLFFAVLIALILGAILKRQ